MRILIPIAVAALCVWQSLGAGPKLSTSEAQKLVMSTPDAQSASAKKHCPKTEVLEENGNTIFVQLRSTCIESGSGLIGNYTVDRYTGDIWLDLERNNRIDSAALQQLRHKLFSARSSTSGVKH